jgi:hypothetical protein
MKRVRRLRIFSVGSLLALSLSVRAYAADFRLLIPSFGGGETEYGGYRPKIAESESAVPAAVLAAAEKILTERLGGKASEFKFSRAFIFDRQELLKVYSGDKNSKSGIIAYDTQYRYSNPSELGLEEVFISIKMNARLKTISEPDFPPCSAQPRDCKFIDAARAVALAQVLAPELKPLGTLVDLRYDTKVHAFAWSIGIVTKADNGKGTGDILDIHASSGRLLRRVKNTLISQH